MTEKLTFTEWCERVDKLAIRDGVCEPGGSYTRRHGEWPIGTHGRGYWFDTYYVNDASPEEAWEDEMALDDDIGGKVEG